ncbi:cation:proton antiporter [Flavobacteriaceae bacterium]|nr:cation:proton antiporter [Flavobacteriaceae bacterium]MDB9826584.1 cation:proton antiporter [bacterium]MDA9184032.1 cation:proton antiporter [Flavobacteriaceae bacterium]MDA9886519.1 cation:proton antiporter [Flavobacteriaceae bacterium]MDB2673090.1 cation:proton antiporter [Flavobacteriaceae bacterium]
MSTLTILIVLPLLIIFSYLFDIISRKTKFPAVILLMFTGIIIRTGTTLYGFTEFGFLENLIPVLGTVGLILIVLEGALELDIKRDKLPVILKGFFAAGIILVLNVLGVYLLFYHFLGIGHQAAVIFAIPLSIISSAVAIPSSASLFERDKEFVVYESTFSDILGIMLFNYAIRQFETNQTMISMESIVGLGLQIIGVIVVSLFITYCLFQLLQKIEHHVKFFLILALLVLVYALGKFFHLPALVTIFIFGLFLSNVKTLLPDFMKRNLDLEETKKGLHEFHILTAESTFLVKTFFFLFFGFSINLSEFTTIDPFLYGLLIFSVMFGIRYVYFTTTTFKFKPSPLVFISPRGLISILLFLQIKEIPFMDGIITVIDERVLLVVILASMLIMTQGTMKKPIEKAFVDAPNSDEIPLDIENTTAALEEETNSEEPS